MPTRPLLAVPALALLLTSCAPPPGPPPEPAAVARSDDATASVRAAYIRARQQEGADDPGAHARRERGALVSRSQGGLLEARFGTHVVELHADALTGSLATRRVRCDADAHAAPLALGAPAVGERPNVVAAEHRAGALAVREWFEAGPLGLEHGLDVHLGSEECDTIVVEIETAGLVVERAGSGARLRDDGGDGDADGGALRYDELYAEDGAGRALRSSMEIEGRTIALHVDARGARSPLRIDPLIYVEQQILRAVRDGDGTGGDDFGFDVALDGNTAIVGAFRDTVGSEIARGSVYVFVHGAAGWALQAKLLPDAGTRGDWFGFAVDVQGDVAVVSAPYEDDPITSSGGVVYVFTRSGTSWTRAARVSPTDAPGAFFGSALAIDGDALVVGAYDWEGPVGFSEGAAYVYRHSGSSWALEARLNPSDATERGRFGESVAIDGDAVIVGAPDQMIGGLEEVGEAYVFRRSGTTWTEEARLFGSGAEQHSRVGSAVAIAGDLALVGAHWDDVAPDFDQGAVYAFARSGGTWTETQVIVAPDLQERAEFGGSIAIEGTLAAIGAPGHQLAMIAEGRTYILEHVAGTGWVHRAAITSAAALAYDQAGSAVDVNGGRVLSGAPRATVGATRQGAARLYEGAGASWTETTLSAGSGGDSDRFGAAVAIAGDVALVGAPEEDVGTSYSAGAVYVLTRAAGAWSVETRIVLATPLPFDRFGETIAFDGTTAFIAALGRATDTGAVFVHERSGGGWSLRQTFSGARARDEYGAAIALDGDTVAIGVPGRDATGGNVDAGGVDVYVRTGATWTLEASLLASDFGAYDELGGSVALDGDTLVAGVPMHLYSPGSRGQTYVWTRSGSSWTEQAILRAVDAPGVPRFGSAVALAGNTAFVGATDVRDALGEHGYVYVFERSGTSWSQVQRFSPSDATRVDRFGLVLAFDTGRLLVGAPWRSSGVDLRVGAAYVYSLAGTTWTEQVRLSASDGRALDEFGTCVAISSDTTLVGAPFVDGREPFGNPDEGRSYVGVLRPAVVTPCTSAAECTTGFCVDGFCCDSACTGQCEACGEPDLEGICVAARGAPRGARAACVGGGTVCGGTCGGTLRASCTYPGATASCRAASCAAGVAALAAACDGAGACPPAVRVDCAPFACGPDACDGDCTSDAECVPGFVCRGGVCATPLALGAACEADSACTSGHCADGVCCDTACGGACEACAETGMEGSCVAVSGAPRGARPACASDGSTCEGACDGADRSACGYPATDTECAPARCEGDMLRAASVCSGAGACEPGASTSCMVRCEAAACVDAGAEDAGAEDAGAEDAGVDAGPPDARPTDAGPRDGGVDAALAPTAAAGCGCRATSAEGSPWALLGAPVLVAWLRRRRRGGAARTATDVVG